MRLNTFVTTITLASSALAAALPHPENTVSLPTPTDDPVVFPYQSASIGYFEFDVPAEYAPFTVVADPNGGFDFDAEYYYVDLDDSSAAASGSANFNAQEVTYAYSDSASSGQTVRVGLGIPLTGEFTTYDAQFTIAPQNAQSESSITIDATLTASGSDYVSAMVNLGYYTGAADAAATPSITNTPITVGLTAPSDLYFSELSYSAMGNVKYDSVMFEAIANGSTTHYIGPCIGVNDGGHFDGYLELTQSYPTINFIAYPQSCDDETLTAEFQISYSYITTVEGFTASQNAYLQKRRGGGGNRILSIGGIANITSDVEHKTLTTEVTADS
ncbi:unnamed protein product [Ambrosiozyma monospora]|uniref:Unnamed protein product n=1 Tax=Ambrosiozyma monospora TaxID=43982 RepID=A0A9W7DES2_AMBMO|nr:unnamed protein product [Ambrosiozyma monospora]